MQVKASQATRMIIAAIKARLVPFIKGSPGIGKSQIVQQIAKEFNLLVIDLRLSQCDPTDLLGFPNIDQARQKAGYMPMETFPLEGEPLPDGYAGWILFLDEFNSAPKAVQAAAYKIVLDRMAGQRHLHKNCAPVTAGNLETDGAIVEPMSTALQSRLVHLELIADAKEWDEWAVANGINHHITSYIKFKPPQLHTFSPDHTDTNYACPRTWEFTSRILKELEDDPHNDLLPLLSGTLGEGVAREFLTYRKIYKTLLKPEQIIANPTGVKVPEEPSILFALTGSIADNMNSSNGDALMEFVKRLPVEFQVVCIREVVRRNKKMLAHRSLQKWREESAATLF